MPKLQQPTKPDVWVEPTEEKLRNFLSLNKSASQQADRLRQWLALSNPEIEHWEPHLTTYSWMLKGLQLQSAILPSGLAARVHASIARVQEPLQRLLSSRNRSRLLIRKDVKAVQEAVVNGQPTIDIAVVFVTHILSGEAAEDVAPPEAHPDGPDKSMAAFWSGGVLHSLSKRQWQLAIELWGRGSRSFAELGEKIWGNECTPTGTIKPLVSQLNDRLMEIDPKISVSTHGETVILSVAN